MSVGWKQGLCNCCGDCSVCMCGACCEPCLVYRNAESLNKSGILCCILGCFFPCIPALMLRSEARERYNIEVSHLFMILMIILMMLITGKHHGRRCSWILLSSLCPVPNWSRSEGERRSIVKRTKTHL